MSEQVIIAIIGAVALIVAAIIGAVATVKSANKKGPKYDMNKTKNVLDIPPIPKTDTNPFDLNPDNQQFGSEDYIEALGTRLLESRDGTEVQIRKINN